MKTLPKNVQNMFEIKLLGTCIPVFDDLRKQIMHYEYEYEGKRYVFTQKGCDSLNSTR